MQIFNTSKESLLLLRVRLECWGWREMCRYVRTTRTTSEDRSLAFVSSARVEATAKLKQSQNPKLN